MLLPQPGSGSSGVAEAAGAAQQQQQQSYGLLQATDWRMEAAGVGVMAAAPAADSGCCAEVLWRGAASVAAVPAASSTAAVLLSYLVGLRTGSSCSPHAADVALPRPA